MVKENNPFNGLNKHPIEDEYIRFLHEYRVASELAALPVINFLVKQTEQAGEDKVLLPTPYLTNAKPFLKALTSYYPKRNFVFESTEESELEIYGFIGSLIKDIEKNVLYCLNDLVDLAFKEEERKGKLDLIVPDSIKKQTAKAAAYYHKEMPEAFEDFPKALIVTWDVEEKQARRSEFPVFQIYNSPDALYADMLSILKVQAMDYSELRLYDFLVQTEHKEMHSTNLHEIIRRMDYLAQSHYVKPVHDVDIRQSLPEDYGDEEVKEISVATEELASNIRRVHDLRRKIAERFVEYLNSETKTRAHEDVYEGYLRGNYPHLGALVEGFFKGMKMPVPDNLRVSGIEYY